ncbi:MAG: arginine--tRNA ligase [Herpetosiphon sp.]|nr:arginine--tRNA ligase [Herpetosiphon sp.]
MNYTLNQVAAEITAALVATNLIAADEIDLATPKATNVQADLALPCFRAAKTRGTNPAQLAQQIASALQFDADSLIDKAEAAGPYVNFVVNPATFARSVLHDIQNTGDTYGDSDVGQGKRAIVEYSSPNIAKRMHVGHIRSTIIGQAIANLYQHLGYEVIRDNHLGDYGKQFGVNIAATLRFGRTDAEGEAALEAIEEQYKRYNALMKGVSADDPDFDPDADVDLDDEARAWSLKLEQGDPQAVELWQWMVDLTKTANQRNYDRLGVHYDVQHGESFYKDLLGEIINDAGESGIAERDGNAVIIKDLLDAKGKKLPTFLLQRSDGGTLYITRDVATIKYREDTYAPDYMIYIVGQPQELHFRQTFATARALGYSDAELMHVSFGTVFDASGQPLSTRKGNMVYLETLLNEARDRAKALIEQKVAEGKTELSSDQIDQIAEIVGVGAVMYNDLYQDTKRNITLDWDRMLAFEGNSAPYLQYMYARCCSILREAGEYAADYDATVLIHPAETALLKELARLPQIIQEAAERFAPFVVADWLYGTARAFSAFYDACSVLKAATPELRTARLHLVAATAQALKNGLALLSIQAPERM